MTDVQILVISVAFCITLPGIYLIKAVQQCRILKRKCSHEENLRDKHNAHEIAFYEIKNKQENLSLQRKNEHDLNLAEKKYAHEMGVLEK
jgi:hypothetical protein